MKPRDEGFTYAEMAVAMTLMLIVFSLMWAGMQVAERGTKIGQSRAYFEQNVGSPMHGLAKVITQNISLDQSGLGPYHLSFLTDQNNDGTQERHVVSADASGTLTEVVYLTDPANPSLNVSVIKSVVWSKENSNVALSQPLFEFYDESGTVLPAGTPATVVSDATQLKMTLSSTWRDQQFSDSRRIWFRNR